MSYEGFEEYICENKHYFTKNCYYILEDATDFKTICPICGKPTVYFHAVDETNGEIEEEPSTFTAPIREVGFEDHWHEDHHGNKYAIKENHYEPDSSQWRKVSTGEKVTSI
mgnify:CR=1 FL=1